MLFYRLPHNTLIYKKLFFAWVITCLSLLWLTTGLAVTAAEDNLLQLLGEVKTMQADFVQTTISKVKVKSGEVIGAMALQRPGKFRWEVKKPMRQLIVANGNLVWVYDADLDQVTKQSLDTNDAGNPAQLLSGNNASLRKTFNVVQLASDNGNNCFALYPKNKNNMYRKVDLCFNGNKLSSMVMEDNLGQSTRFIFNKVIINANISPAQFVFVVPKGVDVIDNL